MDWLHEVTDDLEKQVFDEVANHLNLEVEPLFDTTITCFEPEEVDTPVTRDDTGCPLMPRETPLRRPQPCPRRSHPRFVTPGRRIMPTAGSTPPVCWWA